MKIYLKNNAGYKLIATTRRWNYGDEVVGNEFTIDNDNASASSYLKSITLYNAPVVEALTATIDADKVITAIVAEGTTGVLVFAGYNGKIFATSESYNVTEAGLTKTFDASGYTSARVFLWNDYETLRPLVKAKNFTITK